MLHGRRGGVRAIIHYAKMKNIGYVFFLYKEQWRPNALREGVLTVYINHETEEYTINTRTRTC